jgi:transglutaminase-like putative cysteine protease
MSMNPMEIIEADAIWRLAITHRTVVSYPDPVTASYNEVRMQPSDEPGQAVLSSYVEIDPFEGSVGFWDYFGTRVSAFDIHRPHTRLAVTASSTVERFAPPTDVPPALSWDELAGSGADDILEEYLAETPLTKTDDELESIAAHLRAAAATPADMIKAVCEWVPRTVHYEPGATNIHTSAVEAYQDRRGVCQDLTHVGIALLRSVGIPARYVSGYLHPSSSAEIGNTVTGESHAWFEAWDGRWVGHDPTNAKEIGLGHVSVGRGRDYRDTPPIHGVYAGADAIGNEVSVQLTRLR